MTRLRVEGLTRRFGGLVAVDSVSFDVAREGVTAVIGPNGAGKTTLFSMISGFLEPSSGRVFFEDDEITGLPPEQVASRGLVRTFQLVQLFQNLTVLENVKIGKHLRTHAGLFAAVLRPAWARKEEREVEQTARELLDFVGLSAQTETSASVLPYGQQRLLEIARALASEPKLLLLDEPAAGLNHDETKKLSVIIRKIASQGTTVLLIEHDMKLVMNTADNVAVLEFGRCIAQGNPEVVQKDPKVIEAYLGGVEMLHG